MGVLGGVINKLERPGFFEVCDFFWWCSCSNIIINIKKTIKTNIEALLNFWPALQKIHGESLKYVTRQMKSPAPIRVLDHLPSFRGFPWNKSLLEPIKLLDVLVSIAIVDAGNRSWEHRDTWSCRILTCRLKNVWKQTPSQTQSNTSPIVIPILLCIISTQYHEQSIHPTADLCHNPAWACEHQAATFARGLEETNDWTQPTPCHCCRLTWDTLTWPVICRS